MGKGHILLVADDALLTGRMTRALEARGYTVSACGDAASALIYLRQASIDCLVVAMNLPDQTGCGLLRQARGYLHPIQNETGTPCLPVVMLCDFRTRPRRIAEFHPLACLPRPFPPGALLRLVDLAVMAPRVSGPDSASTASAADGTHGWQPGPRGVAQCSTHW
jgi:DNA-binding response OmpR family regulator